MRRAAAIILAAIAALSVMGLSSLRAGSDSRGQIPPGPPPTPTPTVPCTGCGPTPGVNSGLAFVWSYRQHLCPPDAQPPGSAIYQIVYGSGRGMTQRVTFYGQIHGILRTLNTLNPGERDVAESPPVPQGETFTLELWATPEGTGVNGPRVKWGNGGTNGVQTLTCDCVQPTVQSAPPDVATTTPGTPDTRVNTVPPSPFPISPTE